MRLSEEQMASLRYAVCSGLPLTTKGVDALDAILSEVRELRAVVEAARKFGANVGDYFIPPECCPVCEEHECECGLEQLIAALAAHDKERTR